MVLSVPRKYPPHHYTTSTSLNHWDKAGSMLSCSLRQILTLHLNVAAESRLIRPGSVFTIFYCPVVESVWLYPPCPVLIWPERHPVWSSAAGVHLLQGSTCCVFRDGVLQTLVVTSGCLSYCCLSIISNQSVHSPLTSDINKACSSTQLPLTGCFLFFRPFSVTLEMVVCENPSRYQQSLKYSDQSVCHQQPFHVQSHLNLLSSPFWCSVWTSASRLHHI